MNILRALFGFEWQHFTALGKRAQTLIFSFGIREAARPAFDLFINAFLWRSFGGLLAPAVYSVGRYIALPIGFYINGLLLKKLSTQKMYLLGASVQALAVAVLILLTPSSLPGLLLAGLVYGAGNGIYWGNRNFLTMSATEDKSRNYFVGVEISSAMIVGIVAPVIIGWFIEAGELLDGYSLATAYSIVAIYAFALQVLAGWIVARRDYSQPDVSRLFLPSISPLWWRTRFFGFVVGLSSGVWYILPALLVLTLVGGEGGLGTVQSVSTLLIAILLYLIGRKTGKRARPQILDAGVAFALIAAFVHAAFYSGSSAVFYIMVMGFATALMSDAWSTIFYAAADGHSQNDIRYARIFDHEMFLNAGRVIGALIFIGALMFFGEMASLRFVPALLALTLITFVPLGKSIVERTYVHKTKKSSVGVRSYHP